MSEEPQRGSDRRLHEQVTDFVREKIYAREWGVNEPIPSEHELSEMLSLSRGTVKRGVRTLVDKYKGRLVMSLGLLLCAVSNFFFGAGASSAGLFSS